LSYIGNTNIENWLTPRVETFSANGTTTSFTLTRKIYSLSDLEVQVNGVFQVPGDSFNYDYSNNSIVFVEAPTAGYNNITVRFFARSTKVIAPAQGTMTPDSMSVGAPTWTPTGNVYIRGTLQVDGTTTNVRFLNSANSITAVNNITGAYFIGDGSQITNINAANITTGTVNTGRLGTGTADSTKFLAGDSSWKPVVTGFSTGSTGLTPSSSSTGAVTLSGTLNTSSGGTGLTSFTNGGAVYATSTSALTTGTLPVSAGGTGATNLTLNNILVGAGTGPVATLPPGTANNILVSTGTGWVSARAKDYGIGVTGGGGRGIKYTTNGTFTVPEGVTQIKVTVVGGGGGYVMSPDFKYGSKGGDGGIAVKYVTGLTENQVITVTVGTKGSTLNAFYGSAGTGGTSSFGSYCTATGGLGGYFDYWSIAQDGGPGLGTVGDFNMSGYRFNQIATPNYYGQGNVYGSTVPEGLVLVEY
jgi:hypothetical protein